MKYIIASDIHGSYFWCEKLLKAFENEKADKLILLGDLLYHGPRNAFPDGYSPKDVLSALNAFKDKIIAVRGNCDSEVDQMVLEFPIMADFSTLTTQKNTFFLTHGHIYDERNAPVKKGEVIFNGHFHLPCHKVLENGAVYANCGSVALPKDGTPHSYILLENDILVWKNLQTNEIFDTFTL